MSCSRTQHRDASEVRTRGPSVSSQALYHLATVLPQVGLDCEYFLFISLNIFMLSHMDSSFEYPQHKFLAEE